MRGFTLVELVTVAAIMLILSGIILVNFRSGQGSLALDRSAHKLAQDMKRAMELTLKAQLLGTCPGALPVKGYGVYVVFDPLNPNNPVNKEYKIFGECGTNNTYQDGNDVLVEVLQFEKGVRIFDISPDPDQVNIFFTPPDPRVDIEPGNRATVRVILQLENDPSHVRTVTINKKGVIDID